MKFVPSGIAFEPEVLLFPNSAMPVVGPVVGAVRLIVLAVTVIAVASYFPEFEVNTKVTPVPVSVLSVSDTIGVVVVLLLNM